MYVLAKLKINSLFYDDVMTKFTCNILNFFYLHFGFISVHASQNSAF